MCTFKTGVSVRGRCFHPRLGAVLQEIIPCEGKLLSYWVLVCWPPSPEPLSLQRRVWTHRPDDAAQQLLKRGTRTHTLWKGRSRMLGHHAGVQIPACFAFRWSCSVIFCSALLLLCCAVLFQHLFVCSRAVRSVPTVLPARAAASCARKHPLGHVFSSYYLAPSSTLLSCGE